MTSTRSPGNPLTDSGLPSASIQGVDSNEVHTAGADMVNSSQSQNETNDLLF
jgi:hypothetical protein